MKGNLNNLKSILEKIKKNLDVSRRKKISFFVLVSILHFAILQIRFLENVSTKDTKNQSQVKLVVLDEKKMEQLQQLLARKNKSKEQIVQNELKGENKRPENTRFLGEKDQTFYRQTVAKKNGIFNEAGIGDLKGSREESHSKQEIQKVTSTPPKQEVSEVGKKVKAFKDLSLKDLKFEKVYNKKLFDKTLASEKLGLKNGNPDNKGLSQTNDFIEDVKLGDMTQLNTIEFKYYGFYNRIRKKLEQYWGLSLKEQATKFNKTGRRIAERNHITNLTVVLDDKGSIKKILLMDTSGIQELDQAAIDSFNKAGPFPNPPQGMMVNGEATINWGFVVKS